MYPLMDYLIDQETMMKPVASGTIRVAVDPASERMGNDSPAKLLQTEKNEAIAAVIEEEGENQSSDKHGDTVSISEQGRERAGQTMAMKNGSSSEDDENAADKAKEAILKQIREVKAKLQDAQARLAQVQGGAGASKSASKASEDGEESAEASTQAMAATLGGNAEAEVIQGEIESLNQQLQTLNQQLLDMSKGGGGSTAGGIRAGIGGESSGPSGQGQRISGKA